MLDWEYENDALDPEPEAPDTTARCYNCGCYGDDLGDGEFECPNCGNTWNIYVEPPQVP